MTKAQRPLVEYFTSDSACRACGGVLAEYFASQLPFSISSAVVAVKKPARVFRCRACGLLQKIDSDIVCDYAQYLIFQNSPSLDKIVRVPGRPLQTRSSVVAEWVAHELRDLCRPRLLEIGCHRGAFLKALRGLKPDIELVGYDLDPSYKAQIESICGPDHYFHRELTEVPGKFDACVLVHTFEHVPRPMETLAAIRDLLKPDGLLTIVVPDVERNASDLWTIDHTAHYDAAGLMQLLASAGFPSPRTLDLIPQELAIAARPGKSPAASTPKALAPTHLLHELETFERNLCTLPDERYWVFGTSLIGILIAAILDDACAAFVDEAPEQIGRTVNGKPVHAPQDVAGQTVIMGVASRVAEQAAARLRILGGNVINPWAEASSQRSARIGAVSREVSV